MIWTDDLFVSTADLVSEDPDIVDAADSLNITLTGDSGTIQRATEEAGMYLENILVSFTTYISSNDLSSNHMAAVFYTGSAPNQRRRVTLDQVVVTGRNATYWSECKIWAVNWVLKRFYISARGRAQDDRYATKAAAYLLRERAELWPALKQSGIPIVLRPMPAPDAAQLPNPGSFQASATAGAGTVTANYDVAVTYVDQSRYINQTARGNAEGNPTRLQNVALSTGNVLRVDITNLNPPNGSINPADIARGFVVPLNATGYNIWAGLHGQTLYLQNTNPVPIGTKVTTLTTDPLLSGPTVGTGQFYDQMLSVYQTIKRA